MGSQNLFISFKIFSLTPALSNEIRGPTFSLSNFIENIYDQKFSMIIVITKFRERETTDSTIVESLERGAEITNFTIIVNRGHAQNQLKMKYFVSFQNINILDD